MPVMIGRGDGPGHGTSAAGEDTGAAGVEHGPVRDGKEPEQRRRVSGARTVAAGLRSLHAGSGRVFAAVTLLPALLAVAWLVPGAGLLLAGRLLPVPMIIVSGTLAVALCYFAMRRLPAAWARFSGAERGVPAGALLLMMVIAAGFGLWQAFFRSSQVFAVSATSAQRQLQAQVTVPLTAAAASSVSLTATASAANLRTDPAASAAITVLPTPALPGVTTSLPLGTLTGSAPQDPTLSPGGNASGLFPTIAPQSPQTEPGNIRQIAGHVRTRERHLPARRTGGRPGCPGPGLRRRDHPRISPPSRPAARGRGGRRDSPARAAGGLVRATGRPVGSGNPHESWSGSTSVTPGNREKSAS